MNPMPLKPPTLGTALAVAGKPVLPPRPNRRTGQMGYRKGHPMLTSPAGAPALPAAATRGANQAALNQYVKALSGR